MTMSLGFNGCATLTNLTNSHDLAPNFAGTLYGIINTFGTTSGFFAPMVVAYFTKEKVSIVLKLLFYWHLNKFYHLLFSEYC